MIVGHALGHVTDLPIPGFFFLYGAAAVLLLSFAGLAALWIDPVLERRPSRPLSRRLQAILLSRLLRLTLQTLSVALLALVLVAAFAGTRNHDGNLAPLSIWVLVWLALVPVTVVLGNVWSVVSPFRALAWVARRGRLGYPERLGQWPAAVLLFCFVALELVYPEPADPRALGAAACVYTAVTFAGMLVFGSDAWLRNGEAFAVYFGLFGRLALLTREGGRIVRRPFLRGLARYRAGPGALAFVSIMLGGVIFDSITRTSSWRHVRASTLDSNATRIPAELLLLGVTVSLVAAAYLTAIAFAARSTGEQVRRLAPLFLASLVPIALAYAIAHYFTLLISQGQLIVPIASDPLNRGWDIFGGAGYVANLTPLTTHEVWYIQVSALVSGHVLGLVLAHDRAISLFEGAAALRSQYAMLGLMVLFTVGGLFLLAQP